MKLPSILFLQNRYIRDWEDLKNILKDKNLIQQETFKMSLLCYIRDGLLETWINERGEKFNIDSSKSEDTSLYQSVLEQLTGEKIEVRKSDFSKVCESVTVSLNDKKLQDGDGYELDLSKKNILSITLVSKNACNENFEVSLLDSTNNKTILTETVNWSEMTRGKEKRIDIELKEHVNLRLRIESDDYGTYKKVQNSITFNINEVSFKMIYVEGDDFEMNSGHIQQKVGLDSYYIGETVVTINLWDEVIGAYYKDTSTYPAVNMTRDECYDFIENLNKLTGKKFRLPTEAEWEFAAHGGMKSKNYKYSGSNNLQDVGWYYSNSNFKIHKVAMKQANELGIYDMSGNVWEWCNDIYSRNDIEYKKKTQEAGVGKYYVIRGGSFIEVPDKCCCTHRHWKPKDYRDIYIGFRLALSID